MTEFTVTISVRFCLVWGFRVFLVLQWMAYIKSGHLSGGRKGNTKLFKNNICIYGRSWNKNNRVGESNQKGCKVLEPSLNNIVITDPRPVKTESDSYLLAYEKLSVLLESKAYLCYWRETAPWNGAVWVWNMTLFCQRTTGPSWIPHDECRSIDIASSFGMQGTPSRAKKTLISTDPFLEGYRPLLWLPVLVLDLTPLQDTCKPLACTTQNLMKQGL